MPKDYDKFNEMPNIYPEFEEFPEDLPSEDIFRPPKQKRTFQKDDENDTG
jgi:hypothetical protein